jgi:hypothetical protein
MPLSALWGPEKRGHRSGPRYFDNLKVNSYVGQQYSLETLGCPDGGEIIVGIAFGEYAAERKTVGEFLKSEEASLKATGVTTVTQQLNGRDLYLWGIQSRVTRPGAGGIADYTVLRRLCRRYVAGGVETCSAISRQVHLVRSMAKVY